jgi:hypothetical protein
VLSSAVLSWDVISSWDVTLCASKTDDIGGSFDNVGDYFTVFPIEIGTVVHCHSEGGEGV